MWLFRKSPVMQVALIVFLSGNTQSTWVRDLFIQLLRFFLSLCLCVCAHTYVFLSIRYFTLIWELASSLLLRLRVLPWHTALYLSAMPEAQWKTCACVGKEGFTAKDTGLEYLEDFDTPLPTVTGMWAYFDLTPSPPTSYHPDSKF